VLETFSFAMAGTIGVDARGKLEMHSRSTNGLIYSAGLALSFWVPVLTAGIKSCHHKARCLFHLAQQRQPN
jgi:hypothetical protein